MCIYLFGFRRAGGRAGDEKALRFRLTKSRGRGVRARDTAVAEHFVQRRSWLEYDVGSNTLARMRLADWWRGWMEGKAEGSQPKRHLHSVVVQHMVAHGLRHDSIYKQNFRLRLLAEALWGWLFLHLPSLPNETAHQNRCRVLDKASRTPLPCFLWRMGNVSTEHINASCARHGHHGKILRGTTLRQSRIASCVSLACFLSFRPVTADTSCMIFHSMHTEPNSSNISRPFQCLSTLLNMNISKRACNGLTAATDMFLKPLSRSRLDIIHPSTQN